MRGGGAGYIEQEVHSERVVADDLGASAGQSASVAVAGADIAHAVVGEGYAVAADTSAVLENRSQGRHWGHQADMGHSEAPGHEEEVLGAGIQLQAQAQCWFVQSRQSRPAQLYGHQSVRLAGTGNWQEVVDKLETVEVPGHDCMPTQQQRQRQGWVL